jgi:hypothetical protein
MLNRSAGAAQAIDLLVGSNGFGPCQCLASVALASAALPGTGVDAAADAASGAEAAESE